MLTDPGLISSMLSNANSYLKTDQGFNLLDLAPKMQSLTGSHLNISTLPDAAVQNIMIPAFAQPAGRELHLRAEPAADG